MPAAGIMYGTSCTSSTECVAVGFDIGYQPIVLAGDPASWGGAQMHQVTLGAQFDKYGDGSVLLAVTCTSATACVAVGSDGSDEPFSVTGNPATWTALQAHEISLGQTFGFGGDLFSITCSSSTACVAVGRDGRGQALVLVGDPANWGAAQARSILLGSSFGNRSRLNSITCTSASSCVAVGSDGHGMPIALTGDPSTWAAAQAREISLGTAFGWSGSLNSVACVSSSSCIAVGRDGHAQPLTLSGDPSTWGVAQTHEVKLGGVYGSGGALLAVTCTSPSSCYATGYDEANQPLVVGGDPSTTWTAAQANEIVLDGPWDSAELTSISCASSSDCVATGIDSNSQPFVLSGDPTTWGPAQTQEIPLSGAKYGAVAYPTALTCTSNTSCVQIGTTDTFDGAVPYYIQGNPATWNLADAVLMTGVSPDSYFFDVKCPSPTNCVAVGQDGISGDPLVMTGDPSTWGTASAQAVSLPATFGDYSDLDGVSCTSTTSCVAVGEDGNGEPLVLAGNPATWTGADAKEFKLPATMHSYGGLRSVACTSATACVAVGEDGFFNRQPIVLSGNPASWTVANVKQITMPLALGSNGAFTSVACISAAYCVGAGYSGKRGYKPLIVRGNPATWSASKAFNLAVTPASSTTVSGTDYLGGTSTGVLVSVSCENRPYCVVVGDDKFFAPIYLAGNPTQWKGKLLSRPARQGPSFLAGELDTSTCTTTKCFAGGVSNGGDFVASFTGASFGG